MKKSETMQPNSSVLLYDTTRWILPDLYTSQTHLYYFAQVLTTLEIESNDIGDQGVQHLCEALRSHTVEPFVSISLLCSPIFWRRHLTTLISDEIESEIVEPNIWLISSKPIPWVLFSLFYLCSFTFTFSCRDLIHLILETMKSAPTELKIWLMLSETIQWITFSLHAFLINRYFLIKTLFGLNLWFNKIGDEGLKHLADALQNNKVNFISRFSHDYIFLTFFIVTHRTPPGGKQNQCRWSSIPGWYALWQ
jgi:hypothetical protein